MDVTLTDGENNITIVATDDIGNTQSVVLTVYYDPSAVIISMGTAEVDGMITVGISGDFNINGRVDIGDVAKVAEKVPEYLSADFNDNGRVDIGDAAKITFYLAGKVGEL